MNGILILKIFIIVLTYHQEGFEKLESTWNSSLLFQGLEILEKQYFFGYGA